MTWFIWAFVGFVSLGAYWGLGARDTIWIGVLNFIGPLSVFGLSLKYWNWKYRFSHFDYICLTLSLISIIIWLGVHNPVLALTFNLTADLIAALPTIRKVYLSPSTEDTKTWAIIVISTAISFFAIKQWSYGVALLPAYIFCLSLTITILSLRRGRGGGAVVVGK